MKIRHLQTRQHCRTRTTRHCWASGSVLKRNVKMLSWRKDITDRIMPHCRTSGMVLQTKKPHCGGTVNDDKERTVAHCWACGRHNKQDNTMLN